MKSIAELSGIEKSAMLLVVLGADVASRVLTYLDEMTIFKIAQEIIKIDNIKIEEKEELIGEFLLDLKKNKGTIQGGENLARDILKAAFGDEKAEEILNNLTYADIEKGFSFIKSIDPDVLTSILEKEHPQIITATLYYLSPIQTAAILKKLPADVSKDIIKRMAKMEKPSPKAVIELVRILRRNYEKYREPNNKMEKTDGINILIDIIDKMNPDQGKRLMEYFEIRLPQISEKIKERIFNFENILNLTHQEIQILIDQINDDYLIAKALKGAGDDIKFIFLRNMSQNRATDVINDMENMGALRLSEINESRSYITRIMRMLNDNGYITIKKDQEKYVEA
jgi:flagellar motor switch protein FliG